MNATMIELEEEIVRLRQQLERATAQQSESVGESADGAQYRKQLGEDISRLEVARDQLIETIEEYVELGVSELVLSVSTDDTEKIKTVMENFSEGIMPRFSD